MNPLCSLGVAASMILLCRFIGGAEQLAAQPVACGTFTPSTVTTPDGFVVYLDELQIARSAKESFIIGSPGFAVRKDGTYYRLPGPRQSPFIAGVRMERTGKATLLGSPIPGMLSHPRAALDARGDLHLLWVDGDSFNNPINDQPVRVARWGGASWSEPAPIPGTEAAVIWRQNGVSPPTVIGSALVLISTVGVAPYRTRALTLRDGRWYGLPFPALYQSYLSLVANGDTVVAAFIDDAMPDGNAVFASRSVDAGKTFGAAFRISVPGTGVASDSRMVRLPDGRLVLVWVASVRRESTLFSAYSTDGGRTWITGGTFKPSSEIFSMRAAETNSGKVVVLAHMGSYRRQVPTYLEWRGGWSKPLPLIHDSSSALGIPAVAGGDSVRMAWGEFAPDAYRPVTKYIVLPGNCQPPK